MSARFWAIVRVVAAAFAAGGAAGLVAAIGVLVVGVAINPLFGVLAGLVAFILAPLVGVAHAVLLGLPLYGLLRLRWQVTRWAAALGGFAIGAVPVGARLYSLGGDYVEPWSLAGDGSRALLFGLAGAFGGLAFCRSLDVLGELAE
jgi:hypothetical protein